MTATQARIRSSRRGPDHATITVIGPLDRIAVAHLRDELAAWRESGVVNLRVDLSDISGTDSDPTWTLTSTLARMLAWARVQLRESGGDLIVSGAGAGMDAALDTAAARLPTAPGVGHRIPRQTPHHGYRPETADQP
jgi:ABC-type transporter Mla MlaB component